MEFLDTSEWSVSDAHRLWHKMDAEVVSVVFCRATKGSFETLDETNKDRTSGQVQTRQRHGFHNDRTQFVAITEFLQYAEVSFVGSDVPPVAVEISLSTEILYKFSDPVPEGGDKLMGQREVYAKIRGILDSWPIFSAYVSSCASLMGFSAPAMNPRNTLDAIRMAGFEDNEPDSE